MKIIKLIYYLFKGLFVFDRDGNGKYTYWYEWESDTAMTFSNISGISTTSATTTDYFNISAFDNLFTVNPAEREYPFQFHFSADTARTENLDGVNNWKLKSAALSHSLSSTYTYYSTDGPIDFLITVSQSQNVPFEVSVVSNLVNKI